MTEIEVSRCEPAEGRGDDGAGFDATVHMARWPGVSVMVKLRASGGRFVVRELTVTGDPSAALARGVAPEPIEVTNELLRGLPLHAIRQAIVNHAAGGRFAVELRDLLRPSVVAVLDSDAGRAALDGQAWKWTDDLLEALAREAIRWKASGGTGPIVAHLGPWLEGQGVADVNAGKVRDAMSKARGRGFLAPTKQGSRDVQPGPKLIAEGPTEKHHDTNDNEGENP